jgi:hypothetical protein
VAYAAALGTDEIPQLADGTVVSVQVALEVSISLTAGSPFAGCSDDTQKSLIQVRGEGIMRG